MNGMDVMHDQSRKLTFQSNLVSDREIEVAITDTGPGIAKDQIGKLFEAFYTTKDHGTGFWLVHCPDDRRNLRWENWAENGSHGGAIFRFTLPLAATT